MTLAVFLLLLTVSLIGCDSGRSAFPFTLNGEDGQPATLRLVEEEPGRYLLENPIAVSRTDQAFFLSYRGGGPGSRVTVLGSDGWEVAAKALPAAVEVTVYLPLQRGQIIHGFRVDPSSASETGGNAFSGDAAGPAEPEVPATAAAPAGSDSSATGRADTVFVVGRAELVEAGITEAISGLSDTGGRLTVGTTVQGVHWDGTVVELEMGAPEGWPLRRLDGGAGALGGGWSEDSTAVWVESASLEPAVSGWQIALRLESRAPFDFADFRLRESLADLGGAANLPDPAAGSVARRAEILIHFRTAGDTLSFRHTALQGRHDLFLYDGIIPFIPETLSIEPVGGAAVRLESFQIAHLALEEDTGIEGSGGADGGARVLEGVEGSPAALYPLPADPGTVLLYDQQAWRQPQYELFSWSRFPEILIMDTASYAVQSSFFKRLAFFVEKPGYRGRLVTNREFTDLHGFNAHDYRAEDLARFFQTARMELFPLNPEEELLKQILLANGTISDEGGTFSPGKGGILSISRSSYPLLRRHLLSHECTHGLFFSLPEFRQASFEAWDRLSEREKKYWRLLFRWVGYDTEDPYLTVNEYQAYLFQQPRAGVRYYFSVLTPSRLISSYPAEADWIGELIRSDPDRFIRAFDHLEKALVRTSGVEGGMVVELELAENE